MDGFEFSHAVMKYDIPQGSVLGPLLFLFYINVFNQATQYRKVYQSSKSVKMLHKRVNLDLRVPLHID